MDFNPAFPTLMHVDINSAFATIEQQANPFLRGKPVAVAAYTTGNGCILTASIEAKRLGIKTGMRVREGRARYPKLVVLPPDPDKYRTVNKQLTALLSSYTPDISIESIDEMVMKIPNNQYSMTNDEVKNKMIEIAKEMKSRIKREIGEWITVSIGISTNRYLAKVASGLQKPDGLRWITRENITEILSNMKLEDLCGIKEGNANRLRFAGIVSPLAMFLASATQLKQAFKSIVGYDWHVRLHGYEDTISFDQSPNKSFGQSYALPVAYIPTDPKLWQILAQLVMKMARRLRQDGFVARGVSVSFLFSDHTHWHTQELLAIPLFADSDFYQHMLRILMGAPGRAVRILAITCYRLEKNIYRQQSLFVEDTRKQNLTVALDAVHDRFGPFVVTTARMLAMERKVLDRIAFGKV